VRSRFGETGSSAPDAIAIRRAVGLPTARSLPKRPKSWWVSDKSALVRSVISSPYRNEVAMASSRRRFVAWTASLVGQALPRRSRGAKQIVYEPEGIIPICGSVPSKILPLPPTLPVQLGDVVALLVFAVCCSRGSIGWSGWSCHPCWGRDWWQKRTWRRRDDRPWVACVPGRPVGRVEGPRGLLRAVPWRSCTSHGYVGLDGPVGDRQGPVCPGSGD